MEQYTGFFPEDPAYALPSQSGVHAESAKGLGDFVDVDEDFPSSNADFNDGLAANVEDQEEAPYYACRYCGISDPDCVVRCIESDSWFCNTYGERGTASHIVSHLVRSKNKEICLHPDSPLGETVVECYNCANRNVFMAGCIPAQGESVIVLLCRACLSVGALKDMGWDISKWTPLISDRQLADWLVRVPDPRELIERPPRIVTAQQIVKLEDLWKKNPDATLDDLERPGFDPYGDEDVARARADYDDGHHYEAVYSALLKMEADYDREWKEQMREDNVSLRWTKSAISGVVVAELSFSLATSESLRLTVGDALEISVSKGLLYNQRGIDTSKDWRGVGTVVRISDSGETHLEMRDRVCPFGVEEGYSVSFVWKSTTFDRMRAAMKRFANDDSCVSGYLYHRILGHSVAAQEVSFPDKNENRSLKAPGLPDLNESQSDAVRAVLKRPLSLIQGPPGTGKTVTSATLVYHLVKRNEKQYEQALAAQKDSNKKKRAPKRNRVLVVAPSNVAVDQLAEKIEATGVSVVRLAAKSREHVESSVEHLTLHSMMASLDSADSRMLKELIQKKEDNENHLSAADAKKMKRLRHGIEKLILEAADVVCCTCAGAGDPRIARLLKFRTVLLDEATQATEPESLIPIVLGCHHLVLVGDHCQLGPVVMNKTAANAGLNSSLFERLVVLGLRPIRLRVQYRMHPVLSEFPSNTFYEGTLENGVTAEERVCPSYVSFPWIDPERPLMFYACSGTEEIASTGTSYLNRGEASACERVVTELIRGGVLPNQIGVVTPYEGQRLYILTHMQTNGPLPTAEYQQVEVSSVDAFQGREKDYIILSCVRSNEKQGIGFLNDPRRLNVALTRAKFGCVVLGNPRVLAKRPLWNALLNHVREQGLLVEGALNNLSVSMMRFPESRKFYRDPRQRLFEERAAPVFSGDVYDPFGLEKSTVLPKLESDSRYDPRYAEFLAHKTETENEGGRIDERLRGMFGDFDFEIGGSQKASQNEKKKKAAQAATQYEPAEFASQLSDTYAA